MGGESVGDMTICCECLLMLIVNYSVWRAA